MGRALLAGAIVEAGTIQLTGALAGMVAATPSSQEGEGDAHVSRLLLVNERVRSLFRATEASRAHFATGRRGHDWAA
jgi:hypothetical protein